jgi:hypothetical protein
MLSRRSGQIETREPPTTVIQSGASYPSEVTSLWAGVHKHPEVDELAKREYKSLISEERRGINLIRVFGRNDANRVLDGGLLL